MLEMRMPHDNIYLAATIPIFAILSLYDIYQIFVYTKHHLQKITAPHPPYPS